MTRTTESPKPARARGIQSLETGLSVLFALAAGKGPTALSALAKSVSLPPSQVHRHLASLIAAGMVKQNEMSGRYDLGPGAMRLGLAALARLDIFREADEVFSALARDTGNTSLVSVWGEHGPTIVRWYAGDPPVITPLYIGSTLPILQSAIGRVFFAFGHRATMDKAAKRELEKTRLKIRLPELRDEVIAERGSTIESTMIPGLSAFAAPVFDLQGNLVLVAASVVLATSVDKDGYRRMTDALHEGCRTVTEAIGGRWISN